MTRMTSMTSTTSTTDPTHATTPPGKAALWGGRVLSFMVGGMLVMSASMKFSGAPEVVASLTHLGFASDIATTLGILELTCALLYLVPHTAVLGAVLVTGYLGGAMSVHLRLGEPVHVQFLIGVFAWAGLWLREPRLRRLLPLRSV